jgi:carbon monoxide dehydrogenase subunit G
MQTWRLSTCKARNGSERRSDKVWEALNDPHRSEGVYSRLRALEKKSDKELAATVALKIGPIKATFNGEVTLQISSRRTPTRSPAKAKAASPGFAKGGADVTLTEDGRTPRS